MKLKFLLLTSPGFAGSDHLESANVLMFNESSRKKEPFND